MGLRLGAGEIPAGQHFTRFYRRLVERVDAQQMRGEDGLQHEMHHQGAERALVQRFEVDGAYRSPRLDQGLGDGALLRRDEVAGRTTSEIVGARELGEVGRDARTLPFAGFARITVMKCCGAPSR